MNPIDIESVMESMTILRDAREQDTERARKRYKAFSVPVLKATLDYGDYAYNATLPNGTQIYDISRRIKPSFAIERKMNLDELAGCFTHSRERFESEFERAKSEGARMALLVENATWENLLTGKYQSKLHPNAFKASLVAWCIRYNLIVIFCKEESTPTIIRELLYRDLKEKLEHGYWMDQASSEHQGELVVEEQTIQQRTGMD